MLFEEMLRAVFCAHAVFDAAPAPIIAMQASLRVSI
jgi:hypothetical protein